MKDCIDERELLFFKIGIDLLIILIILFEYIGVRDGKIKEPDLVTD